MLCALVLSSCGGGGRHSIELDLSAYHIQVYIPKDVAVSTADAYRGIVPHLPEKPLRAAGGKIIWNCQKKTLPLQIRIKPHGKCSIL